MSMRAQSEQTNDERKRIGEHGIETAFKNQAIETIILECSVDCAHMWMEFKNPTKIIETEFHLKLFHFNVEEERAKERSQEAFKLCVGV